MNAVGIDVSKVRSMVAVMQPLGVVVAKPYSIRHTASELEELAYSLKSLNGETRVIMEHTGRYYEPIAQALHELGVFVSAVNPILINEYGNNSVRRVKTDKKDAVKIARYGLDNWAELREYTPMDAARQKLQIFNRQRHFSMHNKVAMKNNLITLLDQTFPGVNKLFSSPARDDGSEKWVDFAYTFWHWTVSLMLAKRLSPSVISSGASAMATALHLPRPQTCTYPVWATSQRYPRIKTLSCLFTRPLINSELYQLL